MKSVLDNIFPFENTNWKVDMDKTFFSKRIIFSVLVRSKLLDDTDIGQLLYQLSLWTNKVDSIQFNSSKTNVTMHLHLHLHLHLNQTRLNSFSHLSSKPTKQIHTDVSCIHREDHLQERPHPTGVQRGRWCWHHLRCGQLTSAHHHLETQGLQDPDGQRR